MNHDLRNWLRQRRGAALTEKLFVLLFAALLVGGAAMAFGPMLAAKFEFVSTVLGVDPKTPTLADPTAPRRDSRNALMYVGITFGAVGFFALFLSPMLFPRARRARQRMLVDLAERWPILTPLINPDRLADENMDELRALAVEARQFENQRRNALEIASSDLGRQADPMDVTITGDGVDFDLSSIDGLAGVQDDLQATMAAVPLPMRNTGRSQAVGGDGVPFDAVSPAVKPQMAPQRPRRPANVDFPQIGGADDSATIQVADRGTGDSFVAQVLRDSGSFPAAPGEDSEQTVLRDSAGWQSVNPDAPTMQRDALGSEYAVGGRRSADRTSDDQRRRASDPDATTQQDWDVPK